MMPRGGFVGSEVGLFCAAVMVGPATAQAPALQDLTSGTTALLQAVSAPTEQVVWVSGHEGAVLRSVDGGDSWRVLMVQTLDSLQFRDVHAFDEDRAVILSAGPGSQSRIYRTSDGGATWSLSWLNPEPEGFYDCLDFWDDLRGVAYGDAVDGGLRILLTQDGGATWHMQRPSRLPSPAGSEGGFAASGTCVETAPGGRAWIGTGAGDRPRILRTDDHGVTWDAVDLPLVTGSSAGAFTVVFSDRESGFVLGGDLGQADGLTDNAVRTWRSMESPPFAGVVYGAATLRSGRRVALVAAGPSGLAWSGDSGESWTPLDDRSSWAVGSAGATAWAVGPEGRILRLTWKPGT